jgi:hypothetical protein
MAGERYAALMSSQPAHGPRSDSVPDAGLCDSCEHQVEVRNTRGSVFSLCARSRGDGTFRRYPRLPVQECRGYEMREAQAG